MEQIKFFFKKPKNIKIFLLIFKKKKIGYLLINKINKKNFITEVIDKKFRRKGFAKILIEHAKKKYNNLFAEILLKNRNSLKFHKKLGFIIKKKNKKNIILQYRYNKT